MYKLLESCDTIIVNNKSINYFNDMETIPFMIFNNIFYYNEKYRGLNHHNMADDLPSDLKTLYRKTSVNDMIKGRLFLKYKVISFWNFIETYKELSNIVDRVNENIKEVKIDSSWKLDVCIQFNPKLKEVNLEEYDIETYTENYMDFALIPFDKLYLVYDGLGSVGIGSRNPNRISLEDRLKLYQEDVNLDDMLKHNRTIEIYNKEPYFKKYLSNPNNYKNSIYYHINCSTGVYGAGKGLYLGRDLKALKKFYDLENEYTYDVYKEIENIKWMNLMDYDEFEKFKNMAVGRFGKNENHFKLLTLELGFDGILYFDPYATGEEFVLFNTEKVKKIKSDM